MHIVILTTYFYPHKGGVENYVLQLSKRLIDRGFSIDLLTLNTEDANEFEIFQGMNVYRIPCWNILKGAYAIPTPRGIVKAFNFLRQHKHDCINTHTRFYVTSLIGAIWSRLKKIPLVHIEHGTVYVQHPSPIVGWLAKLVDQSMGRFIIRSGGLVCGVCEAACLFTRKLGAKSPIVIYNGVDVAFFQEKQEGKRSDPGLLSNNSTIITFIGRLIAAKGVQDLLWAIGFLKEIPDLKLFIIGEGGYLPNLKKLAQELNLLPQRVVFLGQRDLWEIRKFLSVSDILVNPSYSEGLPTSVLEAGAMGLPVIATNVGGTSEIIIDRITGLLYPPGDINQLKTQIQLLIDDPLLRKKLGGNLYTRVMNIFGWESSAEKLIQALARLSP